MPKKPLLGTVEDKTTTSRFHFFTDEYLEKFEFLKIQIETATGNKPVLCHALELTHLGDKIKVDCKVIGIVGDAGLEPLRIPVRPGSEVYVAENALIESAIKIKGSATSAFLGNLDGKSIRVSADLQELLSKHIAVLAKTGAGKSYTVGVLLEEVMQSKIPLVIIDPHGEYNSMKFPNDDESDKKKLKELGLKPKSFASNILEYSAVDIPGTTKIKLKDNFTPNDMIRIMPAKLTNSQKALLYSSMKDMDYLSIENVIEELSLQDNNAKYPIIGMLETIKESELFSADGLNPEQLILPGKACIINLKGINPDMQQIIVYKLLKDLFSARKLGNVPPHFVVLEEAHNFCPERGFGEAKSSEIVRLIASEGRKFGMGLCIVSQRPARVDKSVLSQVNSQIILKVSNPNDVKAVSNSVEGLNAEMEQEITNLQVGHAIVSGVSDMPVIVSIRPRKSRHGGMAQQMTVQSRPSKESKEALAVIKQKLKAPENGKLIKSMNIYVIPSLLTLIEQNGEESLVLWELVQGRLVTNLDEGKTAGFLTKEDLDENERKIMNIVRGKEDFDIQELLKNESLFVVGEALSSMIRKGIFYYDGRYKRREDAVYENLTEHGNYYEITNESVNYDKKFDAAISKERLLSRISKVAKVIDYKDCHIMHYVPEYA